MAPLGSGLTTDTPAYFSSWVHVATGGATGGNSAPQRAVVGSPNCPLKGWGEAVPFYCQSYAVTVCVFVCVSILSTYIHIYLYIHTYICIFLSYGFHIYTHISSLLFLPLVWSPLGSAEAPGCLVVGSP